MPERPDFSLKGFLRGDSDEIMKVYKWSRGEMIKRCMRYSADMDLSKDLLHNIFEDILSKGMGKDVKIDSPKQLMAYLLTWMRNETLNHIARENKHEQFHRALGYLMRDSRQDLAPQVENELFKQELWKVLEQIVDTLPRQCGIVYKMVKFKGMDRQAVAATLHITLSSVNNHMSKAHRLIAEKAKDY